ncbi:ANTAR domain protein (plasmid) [Streptomyces sp. CA-256286]|nr:ANTAR domain protein [Streptomyces sp. CA-256286]
MALTRCTPEEAWDMLVRISQHANVKARLVAEAVVTATQGGEVPPGVSRHLKKALKQGKDRPDRPGHANASQR